MNDGNDSPAAGGTTPSSVTAPGEATPATSQSQPSPQPAGSASPAPPPAAQVVATAKVNEREVQLEAEIEVAKVTQKQREQRIMQLEDENRRLKSIPKSKAEKKAGWTLFH